jgi:hypothetical protein
MSRTHKRKTERASVALDVILQAVRAVKVENMTMRSAARYFGIPFLTITR